MRSHTRHENFVQSGSSQNEYVPSPQSSQSRREQKSQECHGSKERVGARPSLAASGSSARPSSAQTRHAVSLQAAPEHDHASASTWPHAAAGSDADMLARRRDCEVVVETRGAWVRGGTAWGKMMSLSTHSSSSSSYRGFHRQAHRGCATSCLRVPPHAAATQRPR